MYGRLLHAEEKLNDALQFVRILTFEVPSKEVKELFEHCELTIQKWSPDRNQSQNAKYWKTVGEIARLTQQPKSAVHNHLLNQYGVICENDGEPVTVSMREGYDYLTDDELHLMPTGKSFELDGVIYDIYFKLKNSHNMTKEEFSRLIDGATEELEECHA